jgi:integrase
MPLPARALPAPALTTTMPCETVVEAYLDAAIDSPHTRRAYERHLHHAFDVFGVASVVELSGADLARYRAAIVSSDLAPGSQAQAMAALRAFLAWSRTLGAHRLSSDVIRTALKTPKAVVRRPYRTLGESDIATVLAMASTARDRALLAVLLGAGLRAAEAVALDATDLHDDPDGGLVIAVRRGKGRKDPGPCPARRLAVAARLPRPDRSPSGRSWTALPGSRSWRCPTGGSGARPLSRSTPARALDFALILRGKTAALRECLDWHGSERTR